MQGEARELFTGGAYFQNVVAVVVAREDLLPAFEVSLSTTNSVPFLELPYPYDPKQVDIFMLKMSSRLFVVVASLSRSGLVRWRGVVHS